MFCEYDFSLSATCRISPEHTVISKLELSIKVESQYISLHHSLLALFCFQELIHTEALTEQKGTLPAVYHSNKRNSLSFLV